MICSHWGQDKTLTFTSFCYVPSTEGGSDFTHLVPVDPTEEAPSSTPNKRAGLGGTDPLELPEPGRHRSVGTQVRGLPTALAALLCPLAGILNVGLEHGSLPRSAQGKGCSECNNQH